MNKEKSILYFVTGNNNKFNEVLKVFQKENIQYNLQKSNVETLEIQANTIEDVAVFKLNSIKDKINGSFFIEDAGFFIDYPLKGFPGVYSSYVFKTIGNEGILKLINGFKDTKAYFAAVIALYYKPFDKVSIFKGLVKGKLSKTIRGKEGFGFDPIFIPDVMKNKTFAEISTEEKNIISHRGQAMRKLISFLKTNNN